MGNSIAKIGFSCVRREEPEDDQHTSLSDLCISNLTLKIGSRSLRSSSELALHSSNFNTEDYSKIIIHESVVDPESRTREIFFDDGDVLLPRFNADSRDDIREGERIGEGQQGPVLEVKWLDRVFAMKKINLDTSQNVKPISKEVTRMLRLQHRNVLRPFGFCLLAQEDLILKFSMIMERMDFDLDQYVAKRWGVIEKNNSLGYPLLVDEGLHIIAEIATGMNYMHQAKYFHCNLKPQNVLMRMSDTISFHVDVKVADFGSSELMGDGYCNPTGGTRWYKPPEQFNPASESMPKKMDVFSFAVLYSRILTGKDPCEDCPVGTSPVEHTCIIDNLATISGDRGLPDSISDVLEECLDVNPRVRPDFQKICGVLDLVFAETWKKNANSIIDLPEGFIIPYEEIHVRCLIGAGSEASIYEVEWKETVYALKIFNDNNLLSKSWVEKLSKLEHKNIVTFKGYSTSSNGMSIILMERMPQDLSMLIEKYPLILKGGKSPLDEQKRWYILKEIAEGVKYLHSLPEDVVHGDLKPRNILVSAMNTGDMVVKLTDFGGSPPYRHTTNYAAPEVLATKGSLNLWKTVDYKKSDAYSFGKICCEILGGVVHSEQGLKLATGMSREDLKDLIEWCLQTLPSKRPDFTQICDVISKSLPVAASDSIVLSSAEETVLEVILGHELLVNTVEQLGLPEEYIDYVIPCEEIHVLSGIASGSRGSIYKVEWKGTLYVQKIIFDTTLLSKSWIKMLPRLNHKNIVAFIGYSLIDSEDHSLTIIMEHMESDLFSLVDSYDSWKSGGDKLPFDEWKSRYLMKEIAEGVAYLHSKGVVHSDLKPGNVLVSAWDTDEIVVKLIDFGQGQFTTRYAAPEVIWGWRQSQKKSNTKSADVYSFGITCCEILSRQLPFNHVHHGISRAILDGMRPKLPTKTSQDLKELIESCWQPNPASRPSFSEICEFFKNSNRMLVGAESPLSTMA